MGQENVRRNSRRHRGNEPEAVNRYKRHTVIFRQSRIRHNYTWLAGIIVVVIMLILCSALKSASKRLEEKNEAYDKQIEALSLQLDEQAIRKETLDERSKYITTKQFVIEFAREKLGLVFKDELIFRPEDNK